MPHQCVKCGTFYAEGSNEILAGCTKCKGKLFFYVKKGREELLAEQRQLPLTTEERAHIEEDVYDLIGNEIDRDKPVVLDLESIRIEKPGTYELDLVNLFHEGQPLVYKLEDGKYVVDLIETFQKLRKKR
jgi:predicted  nucleic acid-binding Zn-ribbon protein